MPMTTSEQAQNVIYWYLRATDAEYTDGMTWYDYAHNLAGYLAGGDYWRGAGVISAYSPQMKWEQNMRMAVDCFTNGIANTKALGNSHRAAQRILDGEHTLDVLKGPKTRAFAAAIADPANSTIATIDRHAYNIAMGTMLGNPTFGVKVFRMISDAYVEAADIIGIGVPQVQAVSWVAFRNSKGVRVST